MGLFDKKDGGTTMGNILRSMKNVAGPMIGIADELLLGGKIGDLMGILKSDEMTVAKAPPLTADELARLTEAIALDSKQLREVNLKVLESTRVPQIARIMPSIIDGCVMTVWSVAGLYMLFALVSLIVAKMSGEPNGESIDATVAVAIFMAIHSHAGNIINYHRGGNSSEQNEHAARMTGR